MRVSEEEGSPLSSNDERLARQVFSWTGKYYAPGLEKPLDALIARGVVRRYFRGGLILDMGCGAGRMADAVFGDLSATFRIDGLDKELEIESSLKAFHSYSWSRKAIHSDFSITGEGNETYDMVFSNNALHLASDINLALREAHRVLKPGGMLVFNGYTTNHASGLDGMNKQLGTFDMQEFAESISSKRLPRYYTKDSMSELLRDGWTDLVSFQYLTESYADMYYLLYLPYVLYWRYETDINNCPAKYRDFKTEFDQELLTLILNSLPAQIKLAMQTDGPGAKIYMVARKASL